MDESGNETGPEAASSPAGVKKARNTDKTMYSHFIKTGIFVIHGRERKKVEQLKCRYCDDLFLYHKVRNLRHLEKVHGFNIHSDSFSNEPTRTVAGPSKVTESAERQATRARASSTNQSNKLPRMHNDPIHTYFEKTGKFTCHGREKKKVEYLKCRFCDESFLSHKIRNIKHLQKNHGFCIESNSFDPDRVKPRFSHIEVASGIKKPKDQALRVYSGSNSPTKTFVKPVKSSTQTVHVDPEKMKKASEALTKVLFIKNIPFDTFEDGSWNEFFSIICPPFELPSAKDIGSKYLSHHYNRTITATHEALKTAGKITLSVNETRISNKSTFINMIACSTRPYLLDCIDVGENTITASYLENQVTEFLNKQKTQGIEFVALITEDEAHMKSLKQNFLKKSGDSPAVSKLLPVFCLRHCINQLMKELLNLSVVKQKLQVIASFGAEVKKSADLKRIWDEIALICGAESKGTTNVPRSVRWMYDVDLLGGAYEERAVIQAIFTNKEPSDLDLLLNDRSNYEKMKKDEFWAELNEVHSVMKPLHEIMLLNETSGASIADAYITMKELMQKKEKLIKLLDKKSATQITKSFDDNYNKVISDHHELASFLHPKYRLSDFNSKTIAGYIKILKSIAECMSLTQEETTQAVKELVDYFAFTSPFDKESFESCTEYSMSAVSWWKAFGQQTQLKNVALVLLSIPAFNSSIEQVLPQEAVASSQVKGKVSPARLKMLSTIKFYEAFVKNTSEEASKKQKSPCEMFNSRSLKVVANDNSEEPIFSDESEDESADAGDVSMAEKNDEIVIAVNSDVLGDLIQSTGIEASDHLNYQITLPQGVAVEWNNINLRQVDSDDIQMSS